MSSATPNKPSFFRRLMLAIAFFIAFIVVGCIILLVLQNTVWNPSFASLKKLHNSTFSKITNNADEVMVVFADNTHALVTDNILDNRRLFLVDLVADERTEIELPAGRKLNFSEFIYGGDVAYAIYSNKDFEPVAFRVTRSGQITELPVIEYLITSTSMEPPPPPALEEAQQRGDLVGLTALEKELCSGNDQSSLVVERRLTMYYVNDNVMVYTNLAEPFLSLLGQRSFPTISDNCDRHIALSYKSYRVEVERTPVQDYSRNSAFDARFQTLKLYRGNELLETLSFSHPNDFYFRSVFVGDRLYLVGANVSYVELSQFN
jgi:hypothetical protein